MSKKSLPEFTTRLSFRLFLLVSICAILCCSCFRVLMLRETDVFNWMTERGFYTIDTKKIIEDVSGRTNNITFKGKSEKEILETLNLYSYDDGYTGLYIYEDGTYRCGISPGVCDDYQIKHFWYGELDVYPDQEDIAEIEFSDTTVLLVIYSYQSVRMGVPYLVVSLMISLLFFIPVILYMRNRMKYIGKLKQEILVMADGDLDSKVTVKGKDEIGILARELNKMRSALNENIRKEEEARKSNHELIRSISHDLRTPMTTMYGYLEILEHKKCTESQQQEYIRRCVQKMEEIRLLSDKMFEYAFVYGTQEEEAQTQLYVEELLEELEKNGQFLEMKGYEVIYEMEGQGKLLGSRSCFQRIWNNLFSNILKYGDAPIWMKTYVEKGNIGIKIVNKKRKNRVQVESNKIGLKSVEKMVELQNGSFFVTEDEENFAVTLQFPLL